MSELLSEDQIEALIARGRDGEPAPKEPQARRARRIREIDFSRPSKFTQDQQKRIERAHEAYCRTVTNQLSADLRMPVELEVINVAQHVWSSALEEVPVPSVFAIIGTRQQSTRILLSIELHALLLMIVRQLGGSMGEKSTGQRDLTEIELVLTRRILGTLIGELSLVWNDLLGTELDLMALETSLAAVQLVPPSDPALVITIEARFKDVSSTISLLLPHRSIAGSLETLSSGLYRDSDNGEPDLAAAETMRTSLGEVDVEIRAEVAAVELPIEDVLALQPGDLLRFKAPAANGVMLYADQVAIHRARPGRSENSRAVSVIEHVELSQ